MDPKPGDQLGQPGRGCVVRHDICVLHAVLQRATFTVDQIVALTGIDKASVESALERAQDVIEEVPTAQSGAGPAGRPKLLRVRESARAEVARRSVQLGQRDLRPGQDALDDAARRVTVALEAVESSIALSKRGTDGDPETGSWQKTASEQLALARELAQFVDDGARQALLRRGSRNSRENSRRGTSERRQGPSAWCD
jgi:hypothetical protein